MDNDPKNTNSTVVGGNNFVPTRDESIDVNKLAFLSNDDEDLDSEIIESSHEEKMEEPKDEEIITPVRNPKNRDEVESPLSKMKKEQAETGKGLKVSNEEIESKLKKEVFEDMVTATHHDTFQKALDDADMSIEKRKRVVMIKAIDTSNRLNVAKAMDEIESVVINEDGTATIDYKDNAGRPAKPEYIRLRTAKDPTWEEEQELIAKMKEEAQNKPETAEKYDETIDGIKEYRKHRQVQVIIEKTGIGGNIEFTEEEKAKLKEADEIILKNIKVVDIKSSNVKRAVRPFSETIAPTQFTGTSASMPVPFPASGFKGYMKPLSYGELGEISNTMSEMIEYEKLRKRYSIIYDKLTNISTGPFKNFNDFLNHFAFADLEVAIFGLLVSSFPEEQHAIMNCNNLSVCYDTRYNSQTKKNEKVPRSYDYTYKPRSIFKLDKCHEEYVEQVSAILSATDETAKEVCANAPVNNSTFIELPGSKFIVEIGVGSAQHFLSIIPALQEEYMNNRFGDRPDKLTNPIMLSYVLSFKIPELDPLGEPTGYYTKYQNYNDLLDIFEIITLDDMRIITSCVSQLAEIYNPVFEFDTATCPYCGTVTHGVSVTPSLLVFQNYNRQINTTLDVGDVLERSSRSFGSLREN